MPPPSFDPGSKNRLTPHDLPRFEGPTLFERLARQVCLAHCLPRKELFESWEVARRIRRLCRGRRVVDLGGGHGLLAHALLLLDDSSPSAVVVDADVPLSAAALHDALVAEWPRLHGRVGFEQTDMAQVAITASDLVVSVHACGGLTDVVLGRAMEAGAPVAVLPCCHDIRAHDDGGLAGWMEASLAIDTTRATRLRHNGYRIWTQVIPPEITPKNRLLIGIPGNERST